jgi:hypothetical protein
MLLKSWNKIFKLATAPCYHQLYTMLSHVFLQRVSRDARGAQLVEQVSVNSDHPSKGPTLHCAEYDQFMRSPRPTAAVRRLETQRTA